MLALASYAGAFGAGHQALTRLALVENRAPVTEKGGGIARDGDVGIALDKSSSMEGAPDQWASALAMAVILEARADGRNVCLVTYDSHVRCSILIDSAASLAAAVLALGTSADGGTDTHAALVAVGKLMAAMPLGGDPADVLLITDGQWNATDLDGAGIERARLRGLFIGGTAPTGSASGFAETWELRAAPSTLDDTGANALAVTIAKSIV